MTKRSILFIFLLSLISGTPVVAEPNNAPKSIAVGQWRHHLPNNTIIKVEETGNGIIGATPYGLIVFNKNDNSVTRINKVDGLSDFDITTIAWDSQRDIILIGYENGNIDAIINNDYVNITDILQASILGSKRINRIIIDNDRALLASNFGIVHMNLNDLLIYDTWFIGPFGSMVQVHDLLIAGDMLYAATNAGLLTTSIDTPNPADYRQWEEVSVIEENNAVYNKLAFHRGHLFVNRTDQQEDIIYFLDGDDWKPFPLPDEPDLKETRVLTESGGRLIIAHDNVLRIFDADMTQTETISNYRPGSVSAFDALYDSGEQLWIGDRRQGLIRQLGKYDFEKILLPGPPYSNAFGVASGGGRLWVAPGAISYGGVNSWNQNGVFLFESGQWETFNRLSFPLLQDVADIFSITVHPANNSIAYAASWFGGLVELSPEGVVNVYNEENSSLQKRAGFEDRLRVGGTAIDRDGNLWVTNSEADKPLSVKKANGQWMAFGSNGIVSPQMLIREIIIDNSNQKWINLPGNGIYVFRENTLDHANNFEARRLTTQINNGGLPNNNVHSIAMDQSGYIWVGTAEGVGIFYSPHAAFSGDPFNAQRIIVEQDDGFAGYLLETETVTTIEVDGSNKKWFGTQRSGAFLLSADGRETIFHFNKENSPLPSNNILDITIDGQSGEVFFATDRGLVSYRGFATEATNRHTNAYAFPNPVRSGYAGYISIKGLVRNANVKITDINGNLVWETIAEGGQAVWNGQNLFGSRPATGVYLVFSTNDDGEETMVTKIMFNK